MTTNTVNVTPGSQDTPTRKARTKLTLLLEETLLLPRDETDAPLLIEAFVFEDMVDSTLGYSQGYSPALSCTIQQGYPKELALQMVESLRKTGVERHEFLANAYQELIEGIHPGNLPPPIVLLALKKMMDESTSKRMPELAERVFCAMNEYRKLRTGKPFF